MVRKLRLLGAELHGAIRTGGASPAMTGAQRLGGEAEVAGPDVRPKPRATEGVTQAVAPAITGPARETGPPRRPPHNDSVPAIQRISRDVPSPGLCWPAAAHRSSWRGTRSKGVVLSAPQSAHPGSSHLTAAQPALNDTASRHPASVFGYLSAATPWTPVSASGRAKRQRHSVTDPIAKNRGFIRPRACRGGATLTWEGRASGKMVFAGALPCALQWAERRARRPLPPSAPRASARPDGSGPTPWRVVCLPLVLPQHSFLFVADIAGDEDGSHRFGFP